MYYALKYYLTILFSLSRAKIDQFVSQGHLGVVDSRFRQCLALSDDYMEIFSDALDGKILQRRTQADPGTTEFDLMVGSWVTVRHPREILLSHVWKRVHEYKLRSKGNTLEEEDLKAYLSQCPCPPTTVRDWCWHKYRKPWGLSWVLEYWSPNQLPLGRIMKDHKPENWRWCTSNVFCMHWKYHNQETFLHRGICTSIWKLHGTEGVELGNSGLAIWPLCGSNLKGRCAAPQTAGRAIQDPLGFVDCQTQEWGSNP